MRNGTGSQWRTSPRSGVTWSYFLLLQMSLAAALSTDWSPSRRHAGAPASRLLQRSTREVTKAATAAFAAPRGSDLMQLLKRGSWRKQQPTVHATLRLMDRSDSNRTRGHAQRSRAVLRPHRHSAHRCRDGYTACGLRTT